MVSSKAIGQVYIRFFPQTGGIERHIHDISAELCRRGYKIHVVTSSGKSDRDLPRIRIVEGVRITRLASYLGNISFSLEMLSTAFSFDLVHIHSFHPWFFTNAAAIRCLRERIPYVITPHFHPARMSLQGLTKSISRFYETTVGLMILKRARAIIALTPSEEAYYRRMGLRNVFLVPNGVVYRPKSKESKDFAERYKSKGEKIILFVGRILEYKGLQVVVEALPHVLKHEKNARLFVVGRDAGYLKEVEQLSRRAGCMKDIRFFHDVNDEDLASFYEIADVIVQPSFYEAFGITVIESWVHRKPVVVYNCGGLSDIVKDGGGIIESSRAPIKWAEDLTLLLGDSSLRQRLGNEGKRLVEENYTMTRVCDKLERVYALAQRS